jgi:hypothetical protein
MIFIKMKLFLFVLLLRQIVSKDPPTQCYSLSKMAGSNGQSCGNNDGTVLQATTKHELTSIIACTDSNGLLSGL